MDPTEKAAGDMPTARLTVFISDEKRIFQARSWMARGARKSITVDSDHFLPLPFCGAVGLRDGVASRGTSNS